MIEPYLREMAGKIGRAVKAAVSTRFAVAVKLNSADFQQGGFTPDEAVQVQAHRA